MNSTDFNEHFKVLQGMENKVLQAKAKEYAHGDRLSNFYDAAELNKETPEQALWGMVTKHIIALKDFITHAEMKDQPPEQIYEKLGDIRNYMGLLSAICYDMHPDYRRFFDERAEQLQQVQASPKSQKRR